MTLRILVCGSTSYDRADRMRYIIGHFIQRHESVSLFDLGGTGADAGARWYRAENGLAGESVWQMNAIEQVRPDYVLCFGLDDRGITDKARAAGITVGEVP